MEALGIDRTGRGMPLIRKNLYKLTFAGAAAFWATNFAISLTPIAADYRAALSITYLPMIIESLIGGLIIGFFVSYFLLRFVDKVPTNDRISKSVILSSAALIIVTFMLEAPARFLMTNDSMHFFLIGALFNLLRILALGVAIGYLYKRME